MKTEQKIFGSEVTIEAGSYGIVIKPLPYMRWFDFAVKAENGPSSFGAEAATECVVDIIHADIKETPKRTIKVCGISRNVVTPEFLFSLPPNVQVDIWDAVMRANSATGDEEKNS